MVRYPFYSLPCTLTKEVQIFPVLGLYSGIFVIYLQCQSNKSTDTGRRANILFYAICFLYVLSTLDFVCDLIAVIFEVSDNSICAKDFFYISCAVACQLFRSSHR